MSAKRYISSMGKELQKYVQNEIWTFVQRIIQKTAALITIHKHLGYSQQIVTWVVELESALVSTTAQNVVQLEINIGCVLNNNNIMDASIL